MSLLGLAPSAPEVEVVVVDKDEDLCRETVERFPDVRVLCGDVTDESLLNEESLFSADLLVAASGNHELNLVTAAYMKSRGVKKAVALTANSSYGAIARKLGVDVAVPMHSVCNRRFEIVEGRIPGKARVVGKTLADFAEKNPNGPLVLMSRASGDETWAVPHGDTVMEPGLNIVLIAKSGDMEDESRFFGKA